MSPLLFTISNKQSKYDEKKSQIILKAQHSRANVQPVVLSSVLRWQMFKQMNANSIYRQSRWVRERDKKLNWSKIFVYPLLGWILLLCFWTFWHFICACFASFFSSSHCLWHYTDCAAAVASCTLAFINILQQYLLRQFQI